MEQAAPWLLTMIIFFLLVAERLVASFSTLCLRVWLEELRLRASLPGDCRPMLLSPPSVYSCEIDCFALLIFLLTRSISDWNCSESCEECKAWFFDDVSCFLKALLEPTIPILVDFYIFC